MDTRKIYNELCIKTRIDPNSVLYVNGEKYNVLIDTIGLDHNDLYGNSEINIKCRVRDGNRYVPYTRTYASNVPNVNNAKIEKVIFHDPATIVFWSDNTKTVVKCQDGDIFDPEKGLAMAIAKKAMGNQGNYCNEIKKWLPECRDATVSVDDLIKSSKTAYISGGSLGLSGTVPAIEDLHRVASEIKERMKDIWDLI